MKTAQILLLNALLMWPSVSMDAAPVGTAFTYQGWLNDAGKPATGSYDLRFAIHDAAVAGAPTGPALTNAATAVSNGLFTVALDFGSGIFNGDARWLEIGVRAAGDPADFTPLRPRQPLTASPYALYAPMAGSANAVAAANVNGRLSLPQLPDTVLTNYAMDATLSGSFSGNGAGLTGISTASLADQSVTSAKLASDAASLYRVSGTTLSTDGNGRVVVDPGNLNSGSVNSSALNFGLNSGEGIASRRTSGGNQYGLDFYTGAQPRLSIANTGNVGVGTVTPQVSFHVVTPTADNMIRSETLAADRGAVMEMFAPGGHGALFFGGSNYQWWGGPLSYNLINAADGPLTFGHFLNSSPLERMRITSAGRVGIGTSTPQTTLDVNGEIRWGNSQLSLDQGGSIELGDSSQLGTAPFIDFHYGAGGNEDYNVRLINAGSGMLRCVGNFSANTITAASQLQLGGTRTVLSGFDGTGYHWVGPDPDNDLAFGLRRHAANDYTLILKGGVAAGSFVGATNLTMAGCLSTGLSAVALGTNTTASGDYSIAMGYRMTASGDYSIAVGSASTASGDHSTAMGGVTTASGEFSTAMGCNAIASGRFSTAMGYVTTAGGPASTAMGFSSKAMGEVSTAMGNQAQALHAGSFVWADSQTTSFASTGTNQFLIRAAGGVGINKDNPSSALDVAGDVRLNHYDLFLGNGSDTAQGLGWYGSSKLFAGANINGPVLYGGDGGALGATGNGQSVALRWTQTSVTVNGTFNNNSDRDAKYDFAAVQPSEVLEKITRLPITTWRYKSDPTSPHIGPMAQDFHAAFGVGTDDRHIAPIDEGGVALAAIQGLNAKVESGRQKAENRMEKLEAENAELKKRLHILEERLNSMAPSK